MRYSGMTLTHQYGGKTYILRQVSKRTAQKAYEAGKTVFLMPCNMLWKNLWQRPCPINREDDITVDPTATFESRVCDFKWYNCDKERGTYPNYFIEK